MRARGESTASFPGRYRLGAFLLLQKGAASQGGEPGSAALDEELPARDLWLRCHRCDAEIAREDDVFSMAEKGPVGVYVNPGGFLHEVVTVSRVVGIEVLGDPTTEASWFVGYAWSLAHCVRCGEHLGWRFDAVEASRPASFWGLRRAALRR